MKPEQAQQILKTYSKFPTNRLAQQALIRKVYGRDAELNGRELWQCRKGQIIAVARRLYDQAIGLSKDELYELGLEDRENEFEEENRRRLLDLHNIPQTDRDGFDLSQLVINCPVARY